MYRIESQLKQVRLDELRSTQITVGFEEGQAKRESWRKLDSDKRSKAMAEEFFPAVRGPRKSYFILDRHHAALALTQERADCVRVGLVKDLSSLSGEDFWVFLDHYCWLRCYDARGHRRPLDRKPARFEDLEDDSYRSLAGEVRDNGGYAKVDVPFLEFLWANTLRQHVPQRLLKNDPKKALAKAMKLVVAKDFDFLPGWCGKS